MGENFVQEFRKQLADKELELAEKLALIQLKVIGVDNLLADLKKTDERGEI
ncbi:hypothetical protein M1K46_07985 [Fictibacillus sp. WQ 8-8]|uniref:hypothetical protein n=1 Tax=Fictibacillus sp. WQ 8-8 TaxID=2938788 RepID=UPI002109B553|nr:hypothetical protein [Fictibacillus sp. WQ 8-8]MCQ6265602.1 hypothetical protein [Fictibacillus sp. WQ 8-8]